MSEYTISLTPAAKSDLIHVVNCFHGMYRTMVDVVMNSFIESCNTIKYFPKSSSLYFENYRVIENRDLDSSIIYRVEENLFEITILAVVINNTDPRKWSHKP